MNLLLRILLVVFLTWQACLYAQVSATSDEILANGTRYLESIYHADQDSLAPLFDGKYYYRSQLITQGHAFFPVEAPVTGSIQIENHTISGIKLSYDVYRDILVYVPDEVWLGELVMNPDLVERFSLGAYRFTNVRKFPPMANEDRLAPEPGYYEVLYAGKTQAYAKRSKSFTENLGGMFDQGKYWERDSRYLVCRGQTHILRKKKDLVKGLGDTSGALRSYMRKEKFRFKNASSADLARLLTYFDSL